MEAFMIGGGGFSLEVLEAFQDSNPETHIAGVFDDDARLKVQSSSGLKYLGCIEDFIANSPPAAAYIIAIGDNQIRETLDQRFRAAGKRPVSVIHPTSCVSPTAEIAEGAYIAAMAFVGPKCRIGRQTIVNVSASIGHNAILADYVQVCPGVRVSGFAQLGQGAFVGSNAVVPPNGRMEPYSKLAANSFAARTVPQGKTALGVPAKLV